ncbi:hypothetical protein Taro_037643 [Colocasia esculenta]|uniref:Transposase Tnp1/En/Spm-like domain-containing protein n=1 Tax=Colocasia esculenta TaxID=4460 RepID=A0A843WAD1_COLES|nr:hypothetical protein [Colocasia esculenta]
MNHLGNRRSLLIDAFDGVPMPQEPPLHPRRWSPALTPCEPPQEPLVSIFFSWNFHIAGQRSSCIDPRQQRPPYAHAWMPPLPPSCSASQLQPPPAFASSSIDFFITSRNSIIVHLFYVTHRHTVGPLEGAWISEAYKRMQSGDGENISTTVQRGLKKRGRNDDNLNVRGKVMVYLKSFKKSLVIVALATIESKDPLKKVGGCNLRCEYWEVAINVALVYNEPLSRPYGQFKTIGDAIGTIIALPSTLWFCVVDDKTIVVDLGLTARACR